MAKERKKLSDKLERIMVQAQLMGLTTADMITISNRMRALEREREQRVEVDAVASRFTWVPHPTKGWIITDSDDGKVYHVTNRTLDYNSRHWNAGPAIRYDITVEKPGTRFHPFTKKDFRVNPPADMPARIMPDNNKELYSILTNIKRGHIVKS